MWSNSSAEENAVYAGWPAVYSCLVYIILHECSLSKYVTSALLFQLEYVNKLHCAGSIAYQPLAIQKLISPEHLLLCSSKLCARFLKCLRS